MALMPSKELSAKINAIGKSATELQSDIQLAAVNAIGYSIQHGDITFGQKLFDALPKGIRRQALITFLEKYGQFAYSTQDKKFKFFKVEGVTFDEDKLLTTPWADAKAENLVSEYDIEKMFDSFMKKVDQAFKKHQESGIVIKHAQYYDFLAEARDRFNAVKFASNDEVEQVA